MTYRWDASEHGHVLRTDGDDLHHDNGEHRSTPPTTNGHALQLHERALLRHLLAHRASTR